MKNPWMRIRLDPLIFDLPDPSCNHGFIKLFHLGQNINQNLQIQA